MNIFEGKIAIVTGGASGIGKSICKYLANHGATVIIADFRPTVDTDMEFIIKNNLGRMVGVDVTKKEELESLIQNTTKEYGRIDYLFNNAGVSINGEFVDTSLEQWKKVMDVNLWGVVYGCHYAYPFMKEQGFGHIINTASLAGLIPGGLTACYSASKHAVVGLSECLRSEAKVYGVKVSTLCPGYIRTNIQKTTENVTAYMNSEKNKKMNENMSFPEPDDCVASMMRGVRRNKSVIISPFGHRIYWWLYRLFPSLLPVLFAKIVKFMKNNV